MRLRTAHLTLYAAGCLGAVLLLAACGRGALSQVPAPVPIPQNDAGPTTQAPAAMPSATPNASSASAGATGAQVTIDNFSFAPQTLTVPAGTTVTWTNQDDMVHTVTSADHVFGSAGLDTGDKFTYTFAKPGVFQYYCSIHPKMTATVIVR